MRLIWSICCLLLLSACKNIVIDESAFIRPDSVVPYHPKTRFDETVLEKLLHQATLKEEIISVNAELALKGLSVQQTGAAVTVLYFGGNRSHIDDAAATLSKTVGSCPIHFTMFDYRGYGRTNGHPTVDNLKDDALRIYDKVRAQTKGPLIIHGHSLGSFMTGYIAQHRPVDGIILETTATNVRDIMRLRTPWYARPFIQASFAPSLLEIDNAKAVSAFTGKSLILSAENDQTTPAELGRQVFDAISNPKKQYMLVAGAGHNEVLQHQEVQRSYCHFVQSFTTLAN